MRRIAVISYRPFKVVRLVSHEKFGKELPLFVASHPRGAHTLPIWRRKPDVMQILTLLYILFHLPANFI